MNRRNKIGLFIGSVSGILAVLIFSAVLFLQSSTFKTVLLKQINQGIPGQLSWETLFVSVFEGSVRLRGVVLQGPDKTVLARVEQLSADLSWQNLMAGEICLSSVRAESFEADLFFSEKGELNLLSAVVSTSEKQAKTPAAPLNIRINQVVFSNGAIAFKSEDKQMAGEVSGLDLTVTRLDLSRRSATLALKIQKGAFRQKDFSIALSPFSAGADISGDQVSHLKVQTALNGVDVDIQGSIGKLYTQPVLDIHMKTRVDFNAAEKTFKAAHLPTGKAGISLSVKGHPGNPEAALSIAYGPGTFQNQSIDSLIITSVLKDRVLTLLPSRLESPLGNLYLEGDVDFKDAFPEGFMGKKQDLDQVLFQLKIRQDKMALSRIPAVVRDLSGRVSSIVTVKGKGVVPQRMKTDIAADIQVEQLAYPAGSPPMDANFTARALLEGEALTLHSLAVRTDGMDLDGQGRLEMPGFDVTSMKISRGRVDLDARNLAWLNSLTRFSAQGMVKMTADLNGSVLSPEIVVNATAQGVRIDQSDPGNITIKATLDPKGRIRIDRAVAEQQETLVKIHGWVDLFDSGFTLKPQQHLKIGVLFDRLGIGKFLPGRNIDGLFSGNADLTGSLAKPKILAGIEGKKIQVDKIRIETAGAKIEFSNGMLDIQQAWIQNKNSRLDIHGQASFFNPDTWEIAPHPLMDLFLDGQKIFIEDFTEEMKGKVSLTGRVKGDPEHLSGTLNIAGNTLEIQGQTLETVSAILTLQDQVIEINEMDILVAPGSRVTATGRVRLPEKTLDIRLTAREFDLARLQHLQRPDLQRAVLSMEMTATGRIDRLADIRVSADISSFAVIRENTPFLRIGPTTVFYKEGGLYLPGTRIDFERGGSLLVRGQGFLDKALDFEASGAFPLEIVTPLVKEIETATGQITVAASLKGSIKKPLIAADLTFDDLSLVMDQLDQEFKRISGHIRVTPDKIDIVRFEGRLGQGQFDLGGSINLASGSFKAFDLKLDTQQLTLDIPDMMELTLNSHLMLAGTQDKSNLTGEIILLQGRYYKDIELDLIAAATQRKRKTAPLSKKKANPLLDRMALNVRVSCRDPLLVDNNMAYLQLSPDLTLRGTAKVPLLAGRATVDAGTINFRKTEFEVKKGRIDFVNPYKNEPAIEINGEAKIQTWIITLMVSGTPDNLDIQLFSDPPESHADIISLIAFGKTTREMGQAQGSGQFSSNQIVSGLLADAFRKSLKEAAGLDQLEIQMDDRSGTGSPGVHVTLGKDLSRQMGIAYGVETRDGETVQRVTTYYKLLENLLVSGFQDSGGKMGGELKYRLEFR